MRVARSVRSTSPYLQDLTMRRDLADARNKPFAFALCEFDFDDLLGRERAKVCEA